MEQKERIAGLKSQKSCHDSLDYIIEEKRGQASDFLDVAPTKHIPFSRNPNFVGRENELLIFDSVLCPKEPLEWPPDLDLPRHNVVIIQGLEGVGKTELALEYAYRAMDNFESILWVAAGTEQKAEASFSELSVLLNMPRGPFRADVRPRDVVITWLGLTDTTWLIIFDNVPHSDTGFLRSFLPTRGSGSILVTTTSPYVRRKFSVCLNWLLDPVREEDSLKLLASRLPGDLTEATKGHARAICRQLGDLPLALFQIAGYLAERGCDLGDFLEAFKSFPHETTELSTLSGYQHILLTVWAMAIAQLETTSLNARRTLGILACLDPDGFPQAVLERICPSLDVGDKYKYMSDVSQIQESIRILQDHHLITVDRRNGLMKIHRTLHDFTKAWMRGDGERAEAFDITVQLLYEIFPGDEVVAREGLYKVFEACDKFCPHVCAALSRYNSIGGTTHDAKLKELVQRFFWYLKQRRLYHEALPSFDTAIKIFNKDRQGNLRYLLSLNRDAGTYYIDSDRAEKAIAYFEEEVKLCEEAMEHGPFEDENGRPMVSLAYEHMSNVNQQLRRCGEAISWHGKNASMLMLDATAGTANRMSERARIDLCVNGSWTMWKFGGLEPASLILDQAIASSRDLQASHPEDLELKRAETSALRVLGNVRFQQGRLAEAFCLHQCAFDRQVRFEGVRNLDTGVTCYRMGCYYEMRGETETAIRYLRYALWIFQVEPNQVPSLIMRSAYKLGLVLRRSGQKEEAVQYLKMPQDLIPFSTMEAYDELVPYWAW